ncbi:hypothetical protein [Desulfarculus baarsii]|uniref:hypothetical protein n=1 Tax=Desulfarculus baarsii TaxID=453230 RepID=UPI001650D5AE|nr:hypothetical protein [Desulfarculus baarsii]
MGPRQLRRAFVVKPENVGQGARGDVYRQHRIRLAGVVLGHIVHALLFGVGAAAARPDLNFFPIAFQPHAAAPRQAEKKSEPVPIDLHVRATRRIRLQDELLDGEALGQDVFSGREIGRRSIHGLNLCNGVVLPDLRLAIILASRAAQRWAGTGDSDSF